MLQCPISNYWIIYRDTGKVIVDLVLEVYKGIGNIRDIIACITFASQVDFALLEAKGSDEILVEARKFFAETDFVGDIWRALSEANAHGLFHPEHVGEVHPCVGVLNWSESARHPCKGSVFE